MFICIYYHINLMTGHYSCVYKKCLAILYILVRFLWVHNIETCRKHLCGSKVVELNANLMNQMEKKNGIIYLIM